MTVYEPGPGSGGFPRPFGDKYTLLSHLAVGGMADVFLAQTQGPAGFEKECVIKRILPHLGLDQEFVQMFLDEARIAARLSHPNIVQIFDLGKTGGDYFLAMEFVDGINLEHVLDEAHKKSPGVLPWPIAVRIIADVAAGLDHAHNVRDSSGRPLLLVHRDVSPSNVMVSWGGAAKILDFGIAKAVVSSVKKSRTEVGTIKGKIPYMSPEQLQGFQLDGRSDVFSLGVILYEVICGTRPFPAETAAQLTMQILHEEPGAPEKLVPAFPQALKPILWKALAKQPAQRWQTAREFQLALDRFLTEQHASCTAYDVEVYLREVLPEGQRTRRPQVHITGTEQTDVSQIGRVAMPSLSDGDIRLDGMSGVDPQRPAQPAPRKDSRERARSMRNDDRKDLKLKSVTGLYQGPSAKLGDLPQRFDDLEAEEHGRRPRRGGSSTVMVAIVVLVLCTAVGLYVVRGYVMKQEAQQGDTTPDKPAGIPAPTEPEKKPPEAVAPIKETVKEPDKAQTPTVPAIQQKAPPPTKEPLKAAVEPVKQVKKDPPHLVKPPIKHVARPPAEHDNPVSLPRLPTPPPPDPE